MKALILLSLLSAGLSGCASGLRRELQDAQAEVARLRTESAQLRGYRDGFQAGLSLKREPTQDEALAKAAREFMATQPAQSPNQLSNDGGGQ